ncbi:MAG: CHASE domain-containing protein [Pseudomonadota bacterium]
MAEHRTPAWHQLPQARWLPACVLVLCLLLTALLAGWSLRTQAQARQASLQSQGETFAQALSSRIQSYVDTLPGLRVFGVLKSAPSDTEFLRYVDAISLQKRFPGLALTFMADRVPGAALDAYVQSVRNDRSLSPGGHPGFAVRPPGQRPSYMVLRHNHPANAATFGYDLYDPTQAYRAAVDSAIDSGGYVATGPLLLARDRFATGQPALTSVVIRAAIYAGGLTPAEPAQRQAAAQGVVGISFRTAEIVRSVLQPELARSAHLRIIDSQALRRGQPALLFDSSWLAGTSQAPPADAGMLRSSIQVADRSWEIQIRPLASHPAADQATLGLLVLGLALSASLTAMTRILVQANLLAERRIVEGTAQLQLEKDNLARSEVRYRMLFANSLDAVMHTLPGGRVLAANPAACALFGCSEATLQAARPGSWIDLSDPRVAALSRARRSTGVAQGQTRLIKADGSSFEAELSTRTYTETGPERREVASLIVRDVTERQQLAEQQARLTAILDATPDFVGSADPAGRNIFLNRAGRHMLGLARDADTSALQIAHCHPPWAANLILQQGIPAATRDGVWFGRTAVQTADGREIPMSQVIICHRSSRGEITHYSTVCRDLSAQEQAERERQAMELRLRESQKMESIGTLAGGIAHDFNNVLAAILGNVAVARQAVPPDHAVQHSLGLIHQAAARARGLVQQIMTFSRRGPQDRSVQRLGPLVDEALALLRATLPASVQLQVALSERPLPALVDPSQVQQVVLNLCTNAWQALPDQRGLVQVHLDWEAPRRDGEAASAVLRVRDNGIGMNAATRQRIFEPFFTTKPVGQGTGLGLAVVHGIVSASGGGIEVDSAPGQGTCFAVRLPLVDDPGVLPGSEPPADAAARGRGEHLLYVDDDEVVALTVQALLENAGYRVSWLSQASQALAQVQADPAAFDLVITDYNMPGMSGLALAEALLALAPGLPVVLASGYVTEDLQARARGLGVQAVLFKEHSVERLGSLVHAILAGRQAAGG